MNLKKIYLLHHSHYDVGFTHSQIVVEQLQTDFLDDVLDVLDATADWDQPSQPRWTIEVHEQLRLWLASSTPRKRERMQRHIDGGRISLGAIQTNTTPLSSLESLCKQLADVRRYREELGFAVKVALQHDVNGIPWVMSDLLLDSGVELLIMGLNLHTGGNGPVRPGMFKWRTPSGRTLKVFSGHHYSTFDVVTSPCTTPVTEMKAAMDAFWALLQEMGYPYDFLFLSSTNVPVAYDNGGPSLMTAEKVREWNTHSDYPTIEYVTSEQFAHKLACVPDESLPEFVGDWSDFWNVGAGSSARETRINANTKQKLFDSALLALHLPQNTRLKDLQAQAWRDVVMYDEHTFGYWASASQHAHPQVVTTEIFKRNVAHAGHEMARYVLGSRLADYAENPSMAVPEGVLAINPSPLKKRLAISLPTRWQGQIFGRLMGLNFMNTEPHAPVRDRDFGTSQPCTIKAHLELEPFSAARLPWAAIVPPAHAKNLHAYSEEESAAIQTLDGHDAELRTRGNRVIESPFHRLEYTPANGRIVRLLDKQTGWEVLPEDAEYGFFEPIHEKPDPRFDASRKSYYDRVVEIETKLIPCWKDWKAARTGVTAFHGLTVERDERSVSLTRVFSLEGAPRILQTFTLSADLPWIDVAVMVEKEKVLSAESIYFATQLNLKAGWEATYDSSGIPVKLDEEQLDQTSNGWVTGEAFTRMSDSTHQFHLFAPEIPLVQFGDFHFGRPKARIPRPATPLHLAWACNNYWETNYPTCQEGIIRFHCAIYTSSGASNADAYRLADGFSRKPLFLPLAACAEPQSKTLVSLDNPAVRLASIDESQAHCGIIIRLINYSDCAETCRVDCVQDLQAAWHISPTQELLAPCSITGSSVTLQVLPTGICSLLIQQKEPI